MPGGDRTGPMGAGPMTGRGAGFCAGYDRVKHVNQVPDRGYASGFQRGRCGRRNQYYATGLPGWARCFGGAVDRAAVSPAGFGAAMTANGVPSGDMNYLKAKARYLKEELDSIEARLHELQPNNQKRDQV